MKSTEYNDLPMTSQRARMIAKRGEDLIQILRSMSPDVDLPEWIQAKIERAWSLVDDAYDYLESRGELTKGAQHKYTHKKRVGTDRKGRPQWRYFYNVRHGGGIGGAALEVKGGEAFQLTNAGQRGHFHVQRVRGNKVTVRHDETGHEVSMSKRELQALLMQEHGEKFKRQKKKPVEAKSEASPRLDPDTFRRKRQELESAVEQRDRYIALRHKPTVLRNQMFTDEQREQIIARLEAEIETLKRETRDSEFVQPKNMAQVEQRLKAYFPEIKSIDVKGGAGSIYFHGEGKVSPQLKERIRRHTTKISPRVNHWNIEILGLRSLVDLLRGLDHEKAYLAEQAPALTSRDELTQVAESVTAPTEQRGPLSAEIERANTADKLTPDRTREPESTKLDRELIANARELARGHSNESEILSAIQDLLNAQRLKTYKRATGDTGARAETMIEKRAEARSRLDRALVGADNFETMPEVEAQPTQRLRGVLDALSESERLNTINPKNRKRPKEAKSADAKLIKLVNELAEDQGPNERRLLGVLALSLQDVEKDRNRNAYERQERRNDIFREIRAFTEGKLGLEPTVTAPNLSEIISQPATPSTRPTNVYGRATKTLVDQALSSEPTGFDPKKSGIDLPTKGDLREMLSQEQRLERAKEDLRSVGAPNFLGQKNPEQDILYALDRYLNGPYVELDQSRLRGTEKGFMIALRDSQGEALEQVKDEIARFWREWGGEYKRLQDEFARGRTQGEALRNIRPFIPESALTPRINQSLDQMERELDQRPITSSDITTYINTRDSYKATRDRQPTTSREATRGADNFETMPETRLNVQQVRAREAIKRARGAQTRIKTGNRADKLTSTGRRASASINEDKQLIEAIERIMDQDYREMERPLPSDINQRTPQQNNFAELRGALNKLKGSQTLTRGSWTDDQESLKKKRIKARSEIEDALKDLEARSFEELQTQIQVNIEDLPPKGQRTAEDAKRFFGEPSKNEAIKRVTYERDGHIVTGPASGRGKGKFRYVLSLPRERFDEPLLSGSFSTNEIGTYDTLDEALTAAINQYEPSDQIIDRMIERAKEERERTAQRMRVTPRDQLTETAREVERGPRIPKSKAAQERMTRVIQESIALDVAKSTSILEESDRYKGYASGQTIAALKSELRPVRLVTSQDSNWGLRLAMDSIQSPIAQEYEQFARSGSTEINAQGRVSDVATTVRGIGAFVQDKLNLSNIQSVRDNADEIEQIAQELIKPALEFFLDRMREQAKQVYTQRVTGPTGGIKFLENRIRNVQERYKGYMTPELTEGANRAVEQIEQTKSAYIERAEQVYEQAVSDYSSASLLDGLLQSQLKYIFSLNPTGRPAKKLTESIIQSVLEQAISEIRQPKKAGPRLVTKSHRSRPLTFQIPQRESGARSALYTMLSGVQHV